MGGNGKKRNEKLEDQFQNGLLYQSEVKQKPMKENPCMFTFWNVSYLLALTLLHLLLAFAIVQAKFVVCILVMNFLAIQADRERKRCAAERDATEREKRLRVDDELPPLRRENAFRK